MKFVIYIQGTHNSLSQEETEILGLAELRQKTQAKTQKLKFGQIKFDVNSLEGVCLGNGVKFLIFACLIQDG